MTPDAVKVKVCGLTRAADAAAAAAAGADYVGVVFAGGPRALDAAAAAEVLAAAGRTVRRVGVFATDDPAEVTAIATGVGLDVVQLHGAADGARVTTIRAATGALVWVTARVEGRRLPGDVQMRYAAADALLLDARHPTALGGTGTRFDWAGTAAAVAGFRGKPLVVAGGLTVATVREAIAALAPSVVDVSSGVESAPGVKDAAAVRAFVEAVRG